MSLKTPYMASSRTRISPSSSSQEGDFRTGGKDKEIEEKYEEQPSASSVYVPQVLGTQQSLNAMADKSLIGETIRLLMGALAPSTQASYLRCWKFWSRYCEARKISPRADTREKDWDMDILNYLTWEYSVMKVG